MHIKMVPQPRLICLSLYISTSFEKQGTVSPLGNICDLKSFPHPYLHAHYNLPQPLYQQAKWGKVYSETPMHERPPTMELYLPICITIGKLQTIGNHKLIVSILENSILHNFIFLYISIIIYEKKSCFALNNVHFVRIILRIAYVIFTIKCEQ